MVWFFSRGLSVSKQETGRDRANNSVMRQTVGRGIDLIMASSRQRAWLVQRGGAGIDARRRQLKWTVLCPYMLHCRWSMWCSNLDKAKIVWFLKLERRIFASKRTALHSLDFHNTGNPSLHCETIPKQQGKKEAPPDFSSSKAHTPPAAFQTESYAVAGTTGPLEYTVSSRFFACVIGVQTSLRGLS